MCFSGASQSCLYRRTTFSRSMQDMTDALVRSVEEACERYARHRELKALSARLYKSLTDSDKAFLKGWQGCEFCGDENAKATAHWDRIFAKKSMPVLPRTMVMYRAVSRAHATDVARRKTTRIDRYSSFAHSPQMAREFALMLAPGGPVTVTCVTFPKGTPFAFASGRDTGGGLSARGRDNIDKTQGEVVLAPMTLTKTAPNRKVTICDGVFTDRYSTTTAVVFVTCVASKLNA